MDRESLTASPGRLLAWLSSAAFLVILACDRERGPPREASIFRDFQERLARSESPAARSATVSALIERVERTGYPIFEDDSTVVLLYRGKAKHVGIVGDMNFWDGELPMQRVPGTGLFFYRGRFEPDARLEYRLKLTSDFSFPDPLNPHVTPAALGPHSTIVMPRYESNAIFAGGSGGEKGGYDRVVRHDLPAGSLPYAHPVYVYLPPGYPEEDRAYATAYFNDGRDYIELAQTPRVLDRLIDSGKIEPIIAVFVTPPDQPLPEGPNRITEYSCNDDYVAFVADELVPFVDRKFRTRRQASSRLIVGASYGGLISVYTAFRRPEIFGMAHSQSGYLSFRDGLIADVIEAGATRPIRLHVDVGTYEKTVAPNFLPPGETDFLAGNRALVEILKAKQYAYRYREVHEGHTWGNWRAHLKDGLICFFGAAEPLACP